MATPSRRIAVIGAGAGGLSIARHLIEQEHDVTVFEKGSHVGGLWVYGNDNGLSVAYQSLHINSEPKVTSYRGFPFPEGTSVVPSHREVAAYLNAFADEYGVRERIRFNSTVDRVGPIDGMPDHGWIVGLTDGSVDNFDSVVVASGHQGVPSHPSFTAEFTGEYLHSNSYVDPLPFVGKRVMVVGVGNSGLDIAADIAPLADQTYVAARSPVLIMPRMMFGVPTPRILGKINRPFLPWVVQRQVMRLVSRMYHGRMEQWGLRTPSVRTHPASNPTFMAHVAYGKIICGPGVRKIEGQTITLENGVGVEVDTLIAATGYDIDLPFLADGVSPVNGHRIDTYKRVVHPSWPGLYFVGFFNVSGGANIAMMDVQSEWVAALESRLTSLPSVTQMRDDIAHEREDIEKKFPTGARYGLELDPHAYKKDLRAEMGRKGGRPGRAPATAGAFAKVKQNRVSK